MKRHLLLASIILFAGTLYSQEKDSRHELFVGYGFSPTPSVPGPELPIDAITNAPYSTKNKRMSGTINVGYLFHVSDPFAIGLSYSYNTLKRDVILGSSLPLAELENRCHTVMINSKYSWLHLKEFSFYSRAAIGILSVVKGEMNLTDTNPQDGVLSSVTMSTDKAIAWQITPVGVEWNFARDLALFIEGGAGSVGVCMTGVKVLF